MVEIERDIRCLKTILVLCAFSSCKCSHKNIYTIQIKKSNIENFKFCCFTNNSWRVGSLKTAQMTKIDVL